jgi:hypothetical protein
MPIAVLMISAIRVGASSARPALSVSDPSRASDSTSTARRRARQQVRRHERRHEKREERQPIERLADRDLSVRRLKVVVDEDDRGTRERDAERAPRAGAGEQDDQQVHEDDVYLIEIAAVVNHRRGHRRGHNDRQTPSKGLALRVGHVQRGCSTR